jgi:hypothetical protein
VEKGARNEVNEQVSEIDFDGEGILPQRS